MCNCVLDVYVRAHVCVRPPPAQLTLLGCSQEGVGCVCNKHMLLANIAISHDNTFDVSVTLCHGNYVWVTSKLCSANTICGRFELRMGEAKAV